MKITPVAGALGAVVEGVDLSDLTDSGFSEVKELWLDKEVLFFRNQNMTAEQHRDLGLRFGDLHENFILPSRKDEGFPEIGVLESGPDFPVVAEGWHTDVTFEDAPTMASVLYGKRIPEFGGDTCWSSMSAAYDALSDVMKDMLDGLYAVHDYLATYGNILPLNAQVEIQKQRPPVKHPIVRTHPESGKKCLFVNPGFTTRKIDGMKDKEAAAIMDFLFDHTHRPEFTCRWRWTEGDVAIWDNRITQHTVIGDNLTAHRRMERITIAGDKPY